MLCSLIHFPRRHGTCARISSRQFLIGRAHWFTYRGARLLAVLYIYAQLVYIYIYLCRLAWVDQKRRQVLYQRYIRATQVLYQLPIKTSGENRQMKQLGIFAAVTIE